MAGTSRTRSALDTLFADNTAGDISAQDLRDFLWSTVILTQSAQSPTTADITGAASTHYLCDISGLTATRNLTLPTATAGDRIRVTITTGDPTYELVIKGAATVTINGGSAATEWSRLFIDNETVQFVATSSTNWQVEYDGRIAQKGRMYQSSDIASHFTDATHVPCNYNTSDYDIGGVVDLTNDYVVPRRAGTYHISGEVHISGLTNDTTIGSVVNANGDFICRGQQLNQAAATVGLPVAVYVNLSTSDIGTNTGKFVCAGFQNSGSAQTLVGSSYATPDLGSVSFLEITEVL